VNSAFWKAVSAIAGVAALLLATAPPAEGQEEDAVNVFYAEVMLFSGAGVNYERLVTRRLAGRVGVFGGGSVPVMAKYLAGGGDHRAEVGLGVWLFPSMAPDVRVAGAGTLGYRYQPQAGGVMFRTTLTPGLWRHQGRTRSNGLLGVSLGYAF